MKAYVYAILVDGVVRYIGKGSGGRVHAHMRIVRGIARRRASGETVRANHFYNCLTKAWLDGAEIQETIIADDLTHEAAYEREITEIAALRNQLWNVWSGGEGASKGHRHSQEQIQKITETNKVTWSDSQLRADHGARIKLKLVSSDVREKLTRPKTEEHNRRVSERAKERWANPEFRTKMEAVFADPDYKKRRSEATKRGWAKRRSSDK